MPTTGKPDLNRRPQTQWRGASLIAGPRSPIERMSKDWKGRNAPCFACLADAGLNIEEVDYFNARGTCTKTNDQTGTVAIKRRLRDDHM